MNKKSWLRLSTGILAVLALAGLAAWSLKAPLLIEPVKPVPFEPPPSPAPPAVPVADVSDMIRVDAPKAETVVTSPLTVTGQARGSWYFEASFPVKLYDADGKLLASAPAQAKGEWMTADYVPFSVTLTFKKPATDIGLLVLERDNPSGLPQNALEFGVPVRFTASPAPIKPKP